MKNISDQLSTYKSVHLNRNNLFCHFLGVPLITWSLMILLDAIPTPTSFTTPSVATLLTIAILFYYLRLHKKLALFAGLLLAPMLFFAQQIADMNNGHWIAIAIFTTGWLIQFIGHIFEKARPAFFDDLNQLIIGPLFLISELYFALGNDPELNKKISQQANKKRQKMNR